MQYACCPPCCVAQGYARRAAEEQLDPGQGFTVDLAIKDVRYAQHGIAVKYGTQVLR